MSVSRRPAAKPFSPALRVLVLLWALLVTTLAPAGATRHVIGHISPEALLPHAAQSPGGHTHKHPPHCHDCDEWQVLDHALTSAVLPDLVAAKPVPQSHPHPATAATARAPWILPRAPPGRV
jgi:hypothetical protein